MVHKHLTNKMYKVFPQIPVLPNEEGNVNLFSMLGHLYEYRDCQKLWKPLYQVHNKVKDYRACHIYSRL